MWTVGSRTVSYPDRTAASVWASRENNGCGCFDARHTLPACTGLYVTQIPELVYASTYLLVMLTKKYSELRHKLYTVTETNSSSLFPSSLSISCLCPVYYKGKNAFYNCISVYHNSSLNLPDFSNVVLNLLNMT